MRKQILLPATVALALTVFAAFFFLRSADGAALEAAGANAPPVGGASTE